MAGTRKALLISTTSYRDPELEGLILPVDKVRQLARLLRRESIGNYEVVKAMYNRPAHVLRNQIKQFLSKCGEEDTLLLYFFGHSVCDDRGTLHIATRDTELVEIGRVGIPAPFIRQHMDQCKSHSQIVMLDCHHTLWLNEETPPADTSSVNVVPQFEGNGRGRIILSSTNHFHNVRYGGPVERTTTQSKYTEILVEALQTGKADVDNNGTITIDEIAEYMHGMQTDRLGDHDPVWEICQEAEGGITFALNPKILPTEKLPKCFVVAPLKGRHGRAEAVFQKYLEPACQRAGFRPWRSDMQRSKYVVPEILSSLKTDPMVIAYLGEPSWNPNVMIEVGYRLATHMPIVMIREPDNTQGQDNEPPLPFDLKDHRVIYLLDEGEEIDAPELLEEKIREIAAQIEDQAQHTSWESPHPVAIISIDRDSGAGQFIESSARADELFDTDDGLTGMSLETLVQKLRNRMPALQFEAFYQEQMHLMRQILLPPVFGVNDVDVPRATRPVVFQRHDMNAETYQDRMYLPIVVQYSKQGPELRMRMLYLDVTGITVEEHVEGGVLYRCELDTPRPMEVKPHQLLQITGYSATSTSG